MHLSIGLKIFSIAVVLAVVMVVAAVLSESRVRRAEVRVDVLADHLLPLADRASELRTIALRGEMQIRRLVTSIASGGAVAMPDAKAAYDKHASEFNAKADKMRADIAAAIAQLSNIDEKLTLTDINGRLDALKAAHGNIGSLVKRILNDHAAGRHRGEAELAGLFETEDTAFDAADAALTKEIRKLVDGISDLAETDEALAISYEHIATAIAAILGLLLAGIMARALVQRIKALRQAAMAVESGDLDQTVTTGGKDELADLCASFNTMVEQLRRKEKTEATFGRYVDPRVVQRLIDETGEDADDLAAGGRQEATILFSDIAGYTGISERLTPAGLVHLMNEYFNLASEPIAASDGLIDKFIGDAVMAFWCPPFAPADEIGSLSCRAALGEMTMVREFQNKLPDITGLRLGGPTIDIRVGLATGEVVVGSIGSERKRNFTVIGDTVNLASRLEGANKFYGTNILICQRTREMIGDQFTVREVDHLAVVGKTEAVAVFELFGEGPPPANVATAFSAFADGLERYRRADWEAAEKSFNACLEAKPGDAPARAFLARVEQLKAQPPKDWDGVWHLAEK